VLYEPTTRPAGLNSLYPSGSIERLEARLPPWFGEMTPLGRVQYLEIATFLEGYLLHTSSAAGLLTTLGDAPYAVSKHAVVALAEWMSITYGGRGIKVSCLCPQGVNTNMLRSGDDPVLYLSNPPGSDRETRRRMLDGLAEKVGGNGGGGVLFTAYCTPILDGQLDPGPGLTTACSTSPVSRKRGASPKQSMANFGWAH